MSEISYDRAPVSVRDDIRAADARAWVRLARPGSWWSGEERIAIASEVRQARTCALCRERKDALSPSAVRGDHESSGKLPAAAVEVIHRIASDPGRLTRSFYQDALTAGLSDGHYVEILGTVVTVVSIDAFCLAIGAPLHPLPDPVPGEPSHYRPASAARERAWVPMIPARDATGAESDLWPGGRTGNVIRAMSLVPDEVRGLKDLSAAYYLPLERMGDFGFGRAINRAQIELVAGRVSALNECFY